MFAALIPVLGSLLDKVLPDTTSKDKAKAQLLVLEQQGELKELETRMSAIVAEANSKDKWTSRARPSFMYVMYVMILACIPMGILTAYDPSIAHNITIGMKAWLGAIPEGLWMTFGIGYTGYSAARSYDKTQILKGLK
jgi:hypothetical protein